MKKAQNANLRCKCGVTITPDAKTGMCRKCAQLERYANTPVPKGKFAGNSIILPESPVRFNIRRCKNTDRPDGCTGVFLPSLERPKDQPQESCHICEGRPDA